ncbi:MAG: transcription elongation factor GreA [Candidatus Omnitrophica bacterium]|nr:transcription elongation factor GreA [Candidatus Omnitrophota bacterium]
MAKGDVFLTREGYNELKEEYDFLKNRRRREISDAIEKARALGDLRENAEYQAAKEAQALNETRISELEGMLGHARIVDNENIDKDKVLLGAKVKIRVVNDNEIEEYMLVGDAEADFNKNKISVTSPLGKGILGKKIGDIVQVKIPSGMMTIEILEINR